MTRSLRTPRAGLLALLLLLLPTLACGPMLGGEREEKTTREKADFHFKMATELLVEKKPIAALREVEQVLALEPDHARAHYLKAFIFMGRLNYREALVHARRALELNPKLYEAQTALAGIYMGMARWREAIDASMTLLEDSLYPSPWLAHNNAGWSYHQLGDDTQSVHHLKQSVFLNPRFCLGYYNLGLVQKERRRYSEAVLALEQSGRACPRHPQTQAELGELYAGLRRTEEARTALRSCRELALGTEIAERCRQVEARLPAPATRTWAGPQPMGGMPR